jgi:hypothetical protein
MNGLILISIGIIAVLVLLGIILIFILRKKKKESKFEEPDYRMFFIMGICFLPMGIVFMITIGPVFISFFGIGLCYMVIGLANKDKWKKED